MYFPYIRARQFDLAAIAEIDDSVIKSEKVIPIIEPVTSIKKGQYQRLVDKNIPLVLVVNPIVGSLSSVGLSREITKDLINDVFSGYENYWIGFIIQPQTTLRDVETFIRTFPDNYHAFIHFHQFRDVAGLSKVISEDSNAHYNIFIVDRVSLDYINEIALESDAQDVRIQDGFNKRRRNEDYPSEEFFSDLHKIYSTELGYDGFGDFTIIGADFYEGGGPAYVVAIHLTDTDSDDNLIMRHFKSDPSTPPSAADPGGKFRIALRRLKRHVDSSTHLDTTGIDEYLQLHRTGHYPGLGILKKISIKHHIEFVYSKL